MKNTFIAIAALCFFQANLLAKDVEFTVSYDHSEFTEVSDFKDLLWKLTRHYRAKTTYGGCAVDMNILNFFPDEGVKNEKKNTIDVKATSKSNKPAKCDPTIYSMIDEIGKIEGVKTSVEMEKKG